MKPFEEILPRHSDAQVGDRRVQRLRIVRNGLWEGDRIQRIVPGQNLKQGGGIFHASGNRAYRIHRVGRRNNAAGAHTAIGSLKANDAAERAWNTNRASIVAAYRTKAHSCRDGRRGTSGGAARNPGGVPGIVHRAEAACRPGAFECHLVKIQLSEENYTRGLQPSGDFRIFRRYAVTENFTGSRCSHARGVDIVF